MAKRIIEVTDTHILKGYGNAANKHCMRSGTCPIAEALIDTLHVKKVSVGSQWVDWTPARVVNLTSTLPRSAQRFIKKFDRSVYEQNRHLRGEIMPFRFILDVPEEVLHV